MHVGEGICQKPSPHLEGKRRRGIEDKRGAFQFGCGHEEKEVNREKNSTFSKERPRESRGGRVMKEEETR